MLLASVLGWTLYLLKEYDLGKPLASRGRSSRKRRSYGPRRQPLMPPVRSAKSAKSASGSGSSAVHQDSETSPPRARAAAAPPGSRSPSAARPASPPPPAHDRDHRDRSRSAGGHRA